MLVEGYVPRPVGTISAADKATNCTLAVSVSNHPRLVPNASVFITGTGYAALDGKWHKAFAAFATTVILGTSTVGDPGTFTAGGTLAVRDTPTPQ